MKLLIAQFYSRSYYFLPLWPWHFPLHKIHKVSVQHYRSKEENGKQSSVLTVNNAMLPPVLIFGSKPLYILNAKFH